MATVNTGVPHASADETRTLADGRRVVVVRSLEGIDAIRDAWLALGPEHVIADPYFFAATVAGDPRIVRPHVVLLERDGEPEALAVARLEEQELTHRLGYRTVYKPRVRALTVVHGGLVGNPDREQFQLLFDELRAALTRDEAGLLIVSYVPVDSLAFDMASKTPSFLARQHVVRSGLRWELELPGSVEEFLQTKSPKHRQTLKRRRKKLERDFEGRLEIRTYESPEQLDEFLSAAGTVSAKTYQHALGVAFGDTPAHRLRTQVAMEHGWFRGWVLYLGGEPAAFWHGERYAGTFRTGNPGFDPAYDAYGIGTYLMLKMVDDLCSDPDVRAIDHGVGDATYKRRYGTRSWTEANVFVFPQSFRGARLNVMLTVVAHVLGAARKVASRAGVLGTAKSRWRRRLGSQSQG
jgi:CelD/BcsL family acetyltransferase involved in cellulose biosynthesis